jgi:hypothetical protein
MTETDHRRERQRAGIAAAVEAGDRARATALASEHLYEFPDDLDVVGAILAARSRSAPGR